MPIKLSVNLSYQRNKIRCVVSISALIFSYRVKFYKFKIKRTLKILGKTVMIKKEEMEFISLEELLNRDQSEAILKDLKQDYKFIGKIVPSLLKKSSCIHCFWFSHISLFNQALTGFIYGLLWNIKSNLISFFNDRINIKNTPIIIIQPEFNQKNYNKSVLVGIFDYKFGNIILMLVNEIINKFKGGA